MQLRHGTQTLIQALQAIPWENSDDDEDDSSNSVSNTPPIPGTGTGPLGSGAGGGGGKVFGGGGTVLGVDGLPGGSGIVSDDEDENGTCDSFRDGFLGFRVLFGLELSFLLLDSHSTGAVLLRRPLVIESLLLLRKLCNRRIGWIFSLLGVFLCSTVARRHVYLFVSSLAVGPLD